LRGGRARKKLAGGWCGRAIGGSNDFAISTGGPSQGHVNGVQNTPAASGNSMFDCNFGPMRWTVVEAGSFSRHLFAAQAQGKQVHPGRHEKVGTKDWGDGGRLGQDPGRCAGRRFEFVPIRNAISKCGVARRTGAVHQPPFIVRGEIKPKPAIFGRKRQLREGFFFGAKEALSARLGRTGFPRQWWMAGTGGQA